MRLYGELINSQLNYEFTFFCVLFHSYALRKCLSLLFVQFLVEKGRNTHCEAPSEHRFGFVSHLGRTVNASSAQIEVEQIKSSKCDNALEMCID